MTDRPLRAPCVHGNYDRHIITKGELLGEWCIGGPTVAVDYEAFRREFWGTQVPNREYEERAQRALIAAFGGSGG